MPHDYVGDALEAMTGNRKSARQIADEAKAKARADLERRKAANWRPAQGATPQADPDDDAPPATNGSALPHHDEPPAANGPEDYDVHGAPREQAMPPRALSKLDFLDPTTWAGQPIPPRRWLVPHRIPLANVTMLNGDGAAGKTTIALQLAAATVRGTDWLGSVVDEPGKAIFFTAEEDSDEIHRRLEAIVAHQAIGFADLAGLHLLCMPGADPVFGAADKAAVIRATPLFESLIKAASEIRPTLIAIEAAADVFAGNENNRSQVRQFLGLLRRLAVTTGAAVLLIAHPSLTGLASGSGTSGSTAWNNSVRSRLYFTSTKAKDGDEPDGDVRELKVMKSNYGPAGEIVRLRWQRGVFVPEGGPSTLARIAVEAEIDEAFLRCLDAKSAQGIAVVPTKGRGYAPSVFEAMSQANGFKSRALALAMERLLSAARIRVETSGPRSKLRSAIVRVGGSA
jgi:RecA-family ATPase